MVSNPPYVESADLDTLDPEVRDYEPREALLQPASRRRLQPARRKCSWPEALCRKSQTARLPRSRRCSRPAATRRSQPRATWRGGNGSSMAERVVEQAVAALRAGQPVVLPTDTVYGLCADPYRAEAAERLYELKGRAAKQPTALVAADLETLFKWVPELRGRADPARPVHADPPEPGEALPLADRRPPGDDRRPRARASWLRTCGAGRRRRHGGDERESSGRAGSADTRRGTPPRSASLRSARRRWGVAGHAVDGHRPHGARADGPSARAPSRPWRH